MVMNIVRYQGSKYGVAYHTDHKFKEDQSGKVKLKDIVSFVVSFLFFLD